MLIIAILPFTSTSNYSISISFRTRAKLTIYSLSLSLFVGAFIALLFRLVWTKALSSMDRQTQEKITQFVGVTGASTSDAKRFLDKYKRVDIAIDAFYNEPVTRPSAPPAASTSKLNALFDKYKDPDGEDITVDGTIKMCEDLDVDPEDVVLLAIAYELKSPRMGEWTKKGWVEGWKVIGVDSIPAMKTALVRLRDKLGSDPDYFRKVYNYTFEFSRPAGQRSLALDMAQGFWQILLPAGLQGGALAHMQPRPSSDDEDERDGDVRMITDDEEGWNPEYTKWWLEFLGQKGGKGISRDTWQMFLDFMRTVDSKFEKYDEESAWPSLIDDFVGYAKERLKSA
ncbi:hypothetical protein QCA50_008312 [Cerrena zonata]|uniref:Defective in cullin neddylation protein n=1 Tax=Cerrena zonata TaxID=2478898 RepID=A0AAW0GF78_9APHY